MVRLRSRWSSLSLFWRAFGLNACVLVVAGLALALTPATVSSPVQARQLLVIGCGLAVLLVVDMVLLRGALRPLARLVEGMHAVDVLAPGRRVPAASAPVEIAELATGFNEMIERLEHERHDAVVESFAAIELERRRIARDLHDQVGQDLTALLMQLDRAARRSGDDELGEQIAGARELTREVLDSVRGIVFELRPDPLEELGLVGALESMCTRVSEMTGLVVRCDAETPEALIDDDAGIAIYRIAQEAITNAVRHSGARAVSVCLQRAEKPWAAVLIVRDDGRPVAPSAADTAGAGLRGIRERALSISAPVAIRGVADGGTELRLDIPRLALP